MVEYLRVPDDWLYSLFYELVDIGFTASFGSDNGILYPYHVKRLYLFVNGGTMDEPIAEKQPYGRRF
jgi:hypothetical protein